MAKVCIHQSIANNQTIQGYATELSNYLNGTSVSGRLGKNGGFERNSSATASGILKIHIKAPGEAHWSSNIQQRHRTSDNYLVYARHWSRTELFQVIALVTPDAHARIDGLLPNIINITEKHFQDLNDSQLDQLTYY